MLKKNIKLLNIILSESNPKKIKQYGRKVKNYNDNTWNQIRYDIMKNGLRLKFNQNQNLKTYLIKTGTKLLYESSPYDKIWGIGFHGRDAINTNLNLYGLNLLGNALMEIRDEFRINIYI